MTDNKFSINEEKNSIIVAPVRDFSLQHTFECGQCFRWNKEEDGSYTGVVRNRVVNVRYDGEVLWMGNTSREDFQKIWHAYFDLDRDYSALRQLLPRDGVMEAALEFGWGMRLLQQDFWETLISFIISSNSNIPKIKRTIEILSREFGSELRYNGKYYYSFPEMPGLSNSSVHHLSVCRGGYRCEYISKTARMMEEGLVDPEALRGMTLMEAKKQLTRLSGVGEKVADCTLLFSGLHREAFPTDVWVKRVMEELYFHREASMGEIQAFARNHFGEYAGLAQQYLFYYAREKKIGVKKLP